MGGAGPYVEFSQSYRVASFATHTGLRDLSEEELEAAYIRAGNFVRQKKTELVDEHSWIAQPEDESVR